MTTYEFWWFEPQSGWIQVVRNVAMLALQAMDQAPDNHEGCKVAIVERHEPFTYFSVPVTEPDLDQ